MRERIRVTALAAVAFATFSTTLVSTGPALAASGCPTGGALTERIHRRPSADPRTYQPVNGTGGFSVFGASTLPPLGLSIGIGYMGENAVCQDTEGDFDLNTAWLALAFGITDRLQIGVDVPYTWFEADRARFDGRGLEDVNFGAVYRLLDEDGWRPGLAVVAFAAAPTAFRHEGIGRNAWDVGTKVVLSKTLPGGLLAHANAGFTYAGRGSFDQDNQFTSGVALELPVNRFFSLVAEGLADTNRRVGTDRHSDWVAETRGGFRVRFADFLLSVAARKGLTNDAPDWGVFALLTYSPGEAERAAARATRAGIGVPAEAGPAAPAAPAVPGIAPAAPTAPGVAPGAPPVTAAVPPSALPPPLRSALRDINFPFDRYDLTEEAKRTLDDLAQALKANRAFNVLIEGHADERGTVEYNLALGERRAQATRDYLISLGVESSRLETISYGEERPLDPGSDELAWALNRRAHFIVRIRP